MDRTELCFGLSRMHGGADPEAAAARFMATLGGQLGAATRVLVTKDYDALVLALVEGDADLAWMPPLPLARALQQGAVLACLGQRRGRLFYRSALVVRAEDERRSLAALFGARVAWTNASSAGGYLVPRAMLHEHGLTRSELAAEAFLGSTAAACEAVAAGRADLATCYVTDEAAADARVAAADLAQALGAALAGALRVLAITPPIPPDGIALSSRLPPQMRARVRAALVELHSTSAGSAAIAALMQAERLAPTTYEAMRLLTKLSLQCAELVTDPRC